MEMISHIQKAIDHIEENIVDDLNISDIAHRACMSSSHFQRVFLAICGVSVGDYIRSRKLAIAGREVITTSAKIIDIAYKYGYETPEGFSRAFTRFHKASPTAARSQGEINNFAKISIISMLKMEDIMENHDRQDLVCSFCGKSHTNVKFLVTSANASICEECVALCGEIVEEQSLSSPEQF